MATYNGARIDQISDLISRLTYDKEQLPNATAQAITTSAARGAGIMAWRIQTAETKTGRARAARGGNGPGRVRSGRLLQSISKDGHFVDISVYGTKVRAEFGYINDPPAYTRSQEYEFYSISGALLAQQLGFNMFLQHIYSDIAKAFKDMDDDAQAKRFNARAARAGNKGANLLDMINNLSRISGDD